MNDVKDPEKTTSSGLDHDTGDVDSLQKQDLLSLEHTDPVLNAKMNLINNAIDEIGFTPYHWKLFCLNGFGCVWLRTKRYKVTC